MPHEEPWVAGTEGPRSLHELLLARSDDDAARQARVTGDGDDRDVDGTKLPRADKEICTGRCRNGRGGAAIVEGEMQLAAAKTVIEKGLSVRRAEALAAQLLKDTQEKPAKKAAGVDYLGECARHLEQVLGRKVRMTQGRKTGRIELEYYDADDREALLQALEAIGRRN